MQTPSDRQGRVRQSDRGYGRGRGRGGEYRRGRENAIGTVPNIQQVTIGAFVSIVLKVDQPTGREVQGIVADVLTGGNHPRGIKVRLADGRVGRVQRMVSEETARLGSNSMSRAGRNGEEEGEVRTSVRGGERFAMRYHDVREDGGEAPPPTGYTLEAFLPPGHPLNQSSAAARDSAVTAGSPEGSASQVCPVCGKFEGDELAVSYHVAQHF
ncbi:hypothetical protein BJ878DRAFT_499329, partial [Calycina marina]